MSYNSKQLKVQSSAKKLPKPKDVDYISKMGYRDDSPFRDNPYNDIYTPNGIIDMSQTGIPLFANGQYLPPYSGMHDMGTENVREIPVAKKGGQKGLKKFTSKNIQTSLNDIMQRNTTLFGPSGKKRYKPDLNYKYGGWLDQYQTKGQTGTEWKSGPVSQSDSVRNMAGNQMRYEHSRGSGSGTGLDNYGNPDLAKKLGRNPTEQEAVDDYMQNIYPQVKDKYPTAMEQVIAGDMLYNSGKEAFNYLPNNWDNRKNPVVSQQNWDKTKITLTEDARRKALNNGRDKYYKNTAPKNSTWDLKTQGSHPAYANTWYGRQHASDQYVPYTEQNFTDKNNPLFYLKKYGGRLDSYQTGKAVTSEADYNKRLLLPNKSKEEITAQNAWASKKNQALYFRNLEEENERYMYALNLLKKYNVTIDSTSNILEDIGANSSAYYNPITRTINYKPNSNISSYTSPKEEYTDRIMSELPHAIQADSLGTLKFLKNTFQEGLQDIIPKGLQDIIPNKSEETGLDRYDDDTKIEGHAHNILEHKLREERFNKLGSWKYGGRLEQYQNKGPVSTNKIGSILGDDGRPMINVQPEVVIEGENSWLDKLKTTLNPYNWGVDDYTKSGTKDQAFNAARKAGEKEYMWNNQRYNTRKDTDLIPYIGNNPNQKEYDKILRTQYPEFYKILNRGKNLGSITWEGSSNEEPNRASINPFKTNSNINVGKNPKTSAEFMSNMIAESGHLKDPKLYNSILNAYDWKVALDHFKFGETKYNIPGTAEYNAHRLIEPGVSMVAYGNLSPNDVKRIQKNLGVEEDGYFGETTYKALQNKYKDNEYIQEAIQNNQLLHQNLDNNPIFSRGTEMAKRYLHELNKEVPLKYYDRFRNNFKNSDYTDAALLSTSGDNMNALLLQRALKERGYSLPKSTTKYGYLDGKYGDETKNALLDWQNKNKKKKYGGNSNTWLVQYQTGSQTKANPLLIQAFQQSLANQKINEQKAIEARNRIEIKNNSTNKILPNTLTQIHKPDSESTSVIKPQYTKLEMLKMQEAAVILKEKEKYEDAKRIAAERNKLKIARGDETAKLYNEPYEINKVLHQQEMKKQAEERVPKGLAAAVALPIALELLSVPYIASGMKYLGYASGIRELPTTYDTWTKASKDGDYVNALESTAFNALDFYNPASKYKQLYKLNKLRKTDKIYNYGDDKVNPKLANNQVNKKSNFYSSNTIPGHFIGGLNISPVSMGIKMGLFNNFVQKKYGGDNQKSIKKAVNYNRSSKFVNSQDSNWLNKYQ